MWADKSTRILSSLSGIEDSLCALDPHHWLCSGLKSRQNLNVHYHSMSLVASPQSISQSPTVGSNMVEGERSDKRWHKWCRIIRVKVSSNAEDDNYENDVHTEVTIGPHLLHQQITCAQFSDMFIAHLHIINKKVTPGMSPSLVGSNPSHTTHQIFDCSDILKPLLAYKRIPIEMHRKVTVTTLTRVSFNLTLVFFKSAAALSTWNFTTKTKNVLTFAPSTSHMHACNLLKDEIHQPDVVVAMRTDIKYCIQC